MSQNRVIFVILFVLINKSALAGVTPCVSDVNCPAASKCVNGICDCDKECKTDPQPINEIGYRCEDSQQCNINNSKCFDNACVCREGFVASADRRQCLQAVEMDGDCLENAQCTINTPSSICLDNKCVCPPAMRVINHACYRYALLGGYCEVPEECWLIFQSECIQRQCTCIKNYVSSRNYSVCLRVAKSLGSLCEEHVQCTTTLGDNSYCYDGSCMCKEMYHFNRRLNKCTLDHLLGERCANHNECHQPDRGVSRLECILGECKCKSDYQEMDGYCVSTSVKLSTPIPTILFSICLVIIYYFNC